MSRIVKQKGAAAILFAILLPMLLALTCLAIDVSNLFLVREKMQVAADSAALAAAVSVYTVTPGNKGTAVTLAQTASQANGFTNGQNQISVTVSIPPGDPYHISPTYASNSSYARVQISQPVPLYFGGIVGISTMTVSANAVAGPTSVLQSVVTLAPSGSGAFQITGSGSVNLLQGSMSVNSSDSAALSVVGSATLTASAFNIAGGYSDVGGTIVGTINTHASNTSTDPFASLTPPTVPSTCNYTNYSLVGSSGGTLNPGTYCRGISLIGSGAVTFNPGTYILNGGGLNIVGSGSVSGTGVTFYNTGQASGSDAYGGISIVGSGSIQLSAPTTGTYAGMLIMQDPKNTQQASITGSSSTNFAGNLYFPGASLTITGSGTMSQPLGITVAQKITITGSGNIKFSNSYGGSTGQVSLFE